MKSILCFELKRCFGSKRLYLSLLTGIVISLLHIIFGVLPLTQWLSSWQGDFFLTPHSACVFCFFTNGLSCFTILPHDVLPCDALTCLLPFGFALAISLLAFCLCIFCSFVWGQVFAISCLVAVSFTEFPSPFLCYAMLIRCRAMSPAGFDERAGLLFYLIFAGIVCFIGMFLFLQLDLFPGLQRRPQ